MTELYLKNNPIIEAVIGISIDSSISYSEIEQIYQNSILKELYPNFSPTKSVSLGINEDGDTISSNNEGLQISTQDNKETVFLEKKRITLVDKNKYEKFPNLFQKFATIWEIANEREYNIKPHDVGFRCLNKFNILNDDIKKFYITNDITLKNNNEFYGKLRASMSAFNIISDKYSAIANVNVQTFSEKKDVITILLDIDVHSEIKDNNIDRIKDILIRLKTFRNTLFTSNFDNDLMQEKFK